MAKGCAEQFILEPVSVLWYNGSSEGGEAVAKTRTSAAVKERYNAKAYDALRIRLPKGQKATVEAAARAAGESVNQYTQGALLARMGLSAWPGKEDAPADQD